MDDLMRKVQEVLSDSESLEQLNELAAMLKEGVDESSVQENVTCGDEQTAGAEMGFDFVKLLEIGQIFGNAQDDDKNTALLLALRPHLNAERQAKIDRAIKLLKLYAVYTILKDSGMLKDML